MTDGGSTAPGRDGVMNARPWTAVVKTTAHAAGTRPTGIIAPDMLAAARGFAAWRKARRIGEYYSVVFFDSDTIGVRVTPLHEHFSAERLTAIVDQMRTRGAPRVRAYYDTATATWLALEGTHRLRAALAIGVAPIMVPVAWPRTWKALCRARFAFDRRGHVFDRVEVAV